MKTPLSWYGLLPYPAADGGSRPDDLEMIMDHIPEFVLAVSWDGAMVHIHIRVRPSHLPLLESLPRVEPAASGSPRMDGFAICHRYRTARHCALPVSSGDTTRPSVYRLLGDSAGGAACLVVSARRAASHPRISGYIRSLERGQSPDGLSGAISRILGGSGKPGPAQLRNIQAARQKAASRHLFRCEIVVAAEDTAGAAAVEAIFPSMSLARAGRPNPRRLDAILARGPAEPLLGGSRRPILSDTEISSFVGLPDEADMASVPMEFGRMGAHSGGERADAAGATSIDIGRPDETPGQKG